MTTTTACFTKSWLILLILTLQLFSFSSVTNAQQQRRTQLAIGGYLPDYRSYINVNATAAHLTDLILFSIQPHSRGMVDGCCLDASHYQLGRQAKSSVQNNHILRLWVTVGGGGRSATFIGIAADPDKRKRLIQGLIQLCEREALDGIDLDLYAPRSQQEHDNYIVFLKEASKAWREAGYLVSIAMRPNHRFPESVFLLVDRVNLMTYDMIETGKSHASFNNVQASIQNMLHLGCPANKLHVGIPAYARHETSPGRVKTFAELFDDETEVERLLSSGSTADGFLFDAPPDIRKKVKLCHNLELGGIFFWELGQDKQDDALGQGGILLEAASKYNLQLMLQKHERVNVEL